MTDASTLPAMAARAVRKAVQGQVRTLVGPDKGAKLIATGPYVDDGLFGPDAPCWRVHGDLGTMLVGGVSALLLQMLHPGALAGVWDHSDFRSDRLGRLKRTARFVANVTYGSREEALEAIAKVRAIHDRVSGSLPDGTPYSANDPELLTWVHVAGMSNFLAAYRVYREPHFPRADQDRYFDETAVIAFELGATEAPQSAAAARDYLEAMRPKLRCDMRTREAARVLLAPEALGPAIRPFAQLIFQAARDLLPPWAQAMHGFRPGIAPKPALRLAVRNLAAGLRWALPDNAEARARRRSAEASQGDRT
jgi:uncharacterized protein (DUF2236 family)